VVEIPQLREVAAIDGATVGVHQLPQRKLIEHFLHCGFSGRHFSSVTGHPSLISRHGPDMAMGVGSVPE
jgi:hypothetical protein